MHLAEYPRLRKSIFVAMQLKSLSLVNFRSHRDAAFAFEQAVAVFTGANGAGKTNILDAIHYLSFCKGFLNPTDSQNIHQQEPFFLVEGKFSLNEKNEQISCGLKRGQAKIFKRNGKEYQKLSEHIGLFPLVLIAPTDIVLISGGSEERRKFTDSVISQFDRNYLENLIRYGKILQQRNAYLRQQQRDASMLAVLNMQLCRYAPEIHQARKDFLGKIAPLFSQYYHILSGHAEEVSLDYESGLNEASMEDLLEQSAERDRVMQYTTEGIHKDDLEIRVNNLPLRRFASQGQQKSILIALKLAQFDVMAELKGVKPLLLLDDIFEKLDQERITALMELVSQHHFGQIFITDSHPERVTDILGSIDCLHDHFSIEPTVKQTVTS